MAAALEFLEAQGATRPELAEWYTALADLYQRKLWHQLTLKLDQFLALAVVQVCRLTQPTKISRFVPLIVSRGVRFDLIRVKWGVLYVRVVNFSFSVMLGAEVLNCSWCSRIVMISHG
jgi:hypothetical protein